MPHQYIFPYFSIFFIIGMGVLSYVSYYWWDYKFIRGASDKNSTHKQSWYKKPLGSGSSCLSLPVVGLGGVGYPGEAEDFSYDLVSLCADRPYIWALGLALFYLWVCKYLWGQSGLEWSVQASGLGGLFEKSVEKSLEEAIKEGISFKGYSGVEEASLLKPEEVKTKKPKQWLVPGGGASYCAAFVLGLMIGLLSPFLVLAVILLCLMKVVFSGLGWVLSHVSRWVVSFLAWVSASLSWLVEGFSGSAKEISCFLAGLARAFHHSVNLALGFSPNGEPTEMDESEFLLYLSMSAYLSLVVLLFLVLLVWGVDVSVGFESASLVSDVWSIHLPKGF